MADTVVRPAPLSSVLCSIEALRAHFTEHFDRGWLAMIIDDLPIDFTTFRQVRQTLSLTKVYPEDIPELRFSVRELERFSKDLRRHLLPVLRERLGVSGLVRPRAQVDQLQRVHRKLLCLSFPHNLARLEQLVEELHRALDRVVAADQLPSEESADLEDAVTLAN